MKKDLGAIYQIKKCWKEEGRREEKESENNWQNLKEDAAQQNNFYPKPETALFFCLYASIKQITKDGSY